jgi:hypothetical protein
LLQWSGLVSQMQSLMKFRLPLIAILCCQSTML